MTFPDERPFSLSLPAIVFCIMLLGGAVCPAQSTDSIAGAEKLFRTGHYSECLNTARKVAANNRDNAQWQNLLISSLMELGQYDQAAKEISSAIIRFPTDAQLLYLAYKANLYAGRRNIAQEMLTRILTITSTSSLRTDTTNVVILGEALLKLGYDPRLILEQVYNPALRADPNCRQAYLSIAELALDKQDYDLAATSFRNGLRRFKDDPDMHCGLAMALYHSDRTAMLESINAALAVNPNHSASRLLLAEHLIDGEAYTEASAELDKIIKINPSDPQAWALRCVIASLTNNTASVQKNRSSALKYWPDNPNVDFLIGSKLSAKYRFTESASYQRQALKFDPNYIPAKIQLAQDLLRLGQEEEGWKLTQEVYSKDKYNIQAYNLLNLHDHLSKYKSLQSGNITVRMETHEAAAYGQAVLELMQQAESVLCKKFSTKIEHPVILEIFPNQQDFAVRTFGIPGGDGFLGVCFGNVVTANSPNTERPSNWQSMLWHEFTHVVTLGMTQNKMPRWLSEGISVYEESQRDPNCGEQMTPVYRSMILDENSFVPISQLSAAFLNPPDFLSLQFAYFESKLVVEFLVKNYGYQSIRGILADLKKGMEINDALSKNADSIDRLEMAFAAFAWESAMNLAPAVDWEEPNDIQSTVADTNSLVQWLQKHPNSFWALTTYAKRLVADSEWEQAEKTLSKIIEIYPKYIGQDNAYLLLAEVYHNQKQTQKEYQILNKLAELSSDALPVYDRLMEIDLAEKNWQGVIKNGQRYFAVYPMLAKLHQELGLANEELGNNRQAIESYERLVQLDPADPVDVHYRLAKLLTTNDLQAAKRHLLIALADAPRFRQAHNLLLQIIEKEGGISGRSSSNEPNKPSSAQENNP